MTVTNNENVCTLGREYNRIMKITTQLQVS